MGWLSQKKGVRDREQEAVGRVGDVCKTHTSKVEAEGLPKDVYHSELQSEFQASLDYSVKAISK